MHVFIGGGVSIIRIGLERLHLEISISTDHVPDFPSPTAFERSYPQFSCLTPVSSPALPPAGLLVVFRWRRPHHSTDCGCRHKVQTTTMMGRRFSACLSPSRSLRKLWMSLCSDIALLEFHGMRLRKAAWVGHREAPVFCG
jgi:hypothetical protein